MYKVRKETLKVISKLAYSIKDETRLHLLNTVRLEIEDDDQLIAVATNGHWLIKFNLQDTGLSEFVSKQENKVFNYIPEKLTFKKAELNDVITFSDDYFTLGQNPREYPKWRAIVPGNQIHLNAKPIDTIGLDLELISEVVKILKVYAPHLNTKLTFFGETGPIRIDPVGNESTFMAIIMPLRL